MVQRNGGWEKGSSLKSGGPRVTQPERPECRIPSVGVASNVGPQRDVYNALANKGIQKRKTEWGGEEDVIEGIPLWEARRKARD